MRVNVETNWVIKSLIMMIMYFCGGICLIIHAVGNHLLALILLVCCSFICNVLMDKIFTIKIRKGEYDTNGK